jgi:hypothetical protein
MPNVIELLGKGATPDVPDDRDFRGELIMGAPLIDWNTPFMLTEPPNEDQNGSSSCVGQAWSYYHWQLKRKNFCRRDIYSWIYLPQGGAQIRDGGLRVVNYGQETRDLVQDPNPETEQGMRDRTGLDPNKARINKELASFVLFNTIDSVAAGIQTYMGVVGGVTGSNPGWGDIANPRPPVSGEELWGHCLYFFGYHMHNGLKCVIAKSSWGNAGGTTVHHIKENYFESGNTFNPWTLIPRILMTNVKLVQITKPDGTKELGYYLPATSEATLIDKALNFDYPLPTINNGANVDWPNVKPDISVQQ